jgi:preprotein translocase subunit SecF
MSIDKNIHFFGASGLFGLLSLVLVVGSWVLVASGQLKLGIDFAGGVEALVSIPSDIPNVSDELLKGVAEKAALKDAEVVGYSFNTSDEGDGKEGSAVARKGFFIRSTTQGGAILESADKIKAEIEKELAGKNSIKLWDTKDESGERIRVQLKDRADRAMFSRALRSAGIIGGMVSAENEQSNPVFALSADDSVRLQSLLRDEIKAAGYTGPLLSRASVVRFEKVGATAGQQLRNKGILAVVYALVFILLYIALRFDPRYSPGAIFALFHDVSITLGVFCLTGREFNLPIIAALLAIVGYSLNDTIVVYDRIRENIEESKAGAKLKGLINISLNECLSRTILTSVTTFLAVLAIYIFGGGIIENFAMAMLVGVVVGTYSSIYIASPIVLAMDNYLEARAAQAEAVEQALKA